MSENGQIQFCRVRRFYPTRVRVALMSKKVLKLEIKRFRPFVKQFTAGALCYFHGIDEKITLTKCPMQYEDIKLLFQVKMKGLIELD